MTFEERGKLIELYRTRCAHARARYELAVEQARQLAPAVREGAIPSPDGSFALTNARREELAAQAEHVRLMKICLKLLRGELPDDGEDWRK